jgi:hypothetical protein
MPVNSCSSNGKPGYKWGDAGKCYTYTAGDEASMKAAKKKALAQGIAIGDIEVKNQEVMSKIAEDLAEEEAMLATALTAIAEKYGKFNEDESGIWAGYESPEENEVKDIGVKCANCVLYEGDGVCKIIAQQVEAEGKCRFAIIPDGVVQVDDEMDDEMDENEIEDILKSLKEWFKEKWVDISRPKPGGGFEPCGRSDADTGKYPKCVPAARAARMSPEEIASAVRRKRRAESTETRQDKKPIYVSTEKAETVNVPTNPGLYARVKAEAKAKFDVYPSAYANAWLVREYKRRGGGYRRVKKSDDSTQITKIDLLRYIIDGLSIDGIDLINKEK